MTPNQRECSAWTAIRATPEATPEIPTSDTMQRKLLTIVLTVALLTSAAPVSAAEDPRFETYVPQETVTPGVEQQLTIQLVNDAEDPEEFAGRANNVKATVRSGDTGIEVKSGTQLLGPMADGDQKQVTVAIDVPADIAGGTHELPIKVEYERNDERETQTVYATVRAEERPRFRIVSTDSTAPVGGQGSVELTVENVGERPAYASELTVSSASPEVTFGGTNQASRFTGEWAPGETRSVTYSVGVAESAGTRNYSLSAQVAYEDSGGNDGQSRSLRLGLRPLPEQTFDVRDLESTLRVGQQGTLEGRIENTGELTARNAVLVFASSSTSATVPEPEYALGTIEPGQATNFSFDVTVDSSANAGPRQFTLRVQYRNEDDDQLQSGPIDVRAQVGPQQSDFEIRNVESSLRVGEEGSLGGEVVNTGSAPVTNAVVVFQSSSQTVTPIETEYALGDLAPGKAASFDFDTEISSSADAGPRQFSFVVRYRNQDNVQRSTGELDVRTDVAPQSEEFDVEPVNASLSAGESGQFRLEVTNTRNETLSDISAKIYTESPLSASDDEAFVEELGPGETTELVFSVAAAGGATAKTYPVKMDFQYDDSDGETQISDTYNVPFRVVEAQGGGLPLPLIAVVVLVIAGGGYYLYRRR